MQLRKINYAIITAIVGLLIIAPTVFAEEKKDANKLLAEMDAAYNKFSDMQMKMTVTLYSGEEVEKVIIATNQEKGGQKRMIRIQQPADVKGMAILSLDADTLYVYLPEYERIRRVAGHSKKNSFLGSDFTEQEMGILRYADAFNAELVEETDAEYILKLTPKPEVQLDAAHLKLYLDKKLMMFNKAEYYAADGKMLKTQKREEAKKFADGYIQTKITLIDHLKNHSTVMEFSEVKVNAGLPDSLFSKRNLEWGE